MSLLPDVLKHNSLLCLLIHEVYHYLAYLRYSNCIFKLCVLHFCYDACKKASVTVICIQYQTQISGLKRNLSSVRYLYYFMIVFMPSHFPSLTALVWTVLNCSVRYSKKKLSRDLRGYQHTKKRVFEIAPAIQSYWFITLLEWGRNFLVLAWLPERYIQNEMYWT